MLTLSPRERALLLDALAVLSSPQSYDSRAHWRAAARRALDPLVGAEPVGGTTARPSARHVPSDDELRGRFSLTARQVEVARLLARGCSARDVAATLGLSYYTARHHVEHVLGKLGVHSRAAVANATAAVDRR